MEKIFNVKGMHCRSCEIMLKEDISEIAGIGSVEASAKTNTVNVVMETDHTEEITKKIEAAGYKVIC